MPPGRPLKRIPASLVEEILDGYQDLEFLNLSDNELSELHHLDRIVTLQRLNLSNNLISDFDALTTLQRLPRLRSLDLRGNPICAARNYRSEVVRRLPRLETLDGVMITTMERTDLTEHSANAVAAAPAAVAAAAAAAAVSSGAGTAEAPVDALLHSPLARDSIRAMRSEVEMALEAQLAEARQQLQDMRAYYAAMPPPPNASPLLPAFDEDRLKQQLIEQERERELERLRDANLALQNRLQLQEVRYRALEDIISVQDQTISQLRQGSGGGEGAVEDGTGLTQKWRQKVFELLVERLTANEKHDAEVQNLNQLVASANRMAEIAAADAELLRQRERTLRAEMEIEATATKMARATLAKVERNEQRLKAELQRVYASARGARDQIQGLFALRADFEERLQIAANKLQSQMHRVQFATTRLALARESILAERRVLNKQTVQAQLSALRAEHEAEMQRLREYLEQQRQALEAQLSADRNEHLSELRRVRQQMEEQRHLVEEQLVAERSEHALELRRLRQQLEEQLASERADHSAEVRHLRQQSDEQRQALELQLATLKGEHATELRRVRQQAEEQLRAAEERYQALMDEVAEARRETAKQSLAVRHLEKQLVAQREMDEDAIRVRAEQHAQEIRAKDEQIRTLRTERNELLASLRQLERRAGRHDAGEQHIGHGSDDRPAPRRDMSAAPSAATAPASAAGAAVTAPLPPRRRPTPPGMREPALGPFAATVGAGASAGGAAGGGGGASLPTAVGASASVPRRAEALSRSGSSSPRSADGARPREHQDVQAQMRALAQWSSQLLAADADDDEE